MEFLAAFADVLDQMGPAATRLLATLLVLLAWYLLYRMLRRVMRRAMARPVPRRRFNQGTARALQRGVYIALLLVAVLVVLQLWGVSVGGLWAGVLGVFTVMGIALMAGWSLLSNATASVLLQVWRPFRRGDHLLMVPDEIEGTILEQNLFFTVLRCSGGDELVVPNTLLFQRMVRVRRGGRPDADAVPTEDWNPG